MSSAPIGLSRPTRIASASPTIQDVNLHRNNATPIHTRETRANQGSAVAYCLAVFHPLAVRRERAGAGLTPEGSGTFEHAMQVIHTDIEGVCLIEPKVFSDSRGFFLETYNENAFAAVGVTERFVQDNQSHSKSGVLRGLHYQIEKSQGKLVRVLQGEIFDVAVDLRPGSRTFGKWTGVNLCARDLRMIWIPRGFAHGFYTLSETADVAYKVTDFYSPQHERTLLWNDPDVGIVWPLIEEPVLSAKDLAGRTLKEIKVT